MPKLYHHAGSWQLPGQQDRQAKRVDVPNVPAELAAWLNARRVPATAVDELIRNAALDRIDAEAAGVELEPIPQLASEAKPPAPPPPAPAIKPPAIGASADELVDWLFDHASNSQIHDVMSAITDRFAEAIKHTREKGQ
jgi:hypothetical protein